MTHRKFAIVTGASRGIGRTLTERLAATGYDVLAIARRFPGDGTGQRITRLALDLAAHDAASVFAKAVQRAGCPVDLLINNAGMQVSHDLSDPCNLDRSRAIRSEIALNLEVPIRLPWSLFPFIRRPGGTVVNVTSLVARHPKTSAPVYSASKAGLRSFTSALRTQARPEGVLVMEAILLLVDTAMTAGRGHGKNSAEKMSDAILDGVDS